MPIHNLGYRPWKEKLTSATTRWWSISATGIRAAQSSAWVKRVVFASWLPVLYWGMGFFLIGQALEGKLKLDGRFGTQIVTAVQDQLPPDKKKLLEDTKLAANRKIAGSILRNRFKRFHQVDQIATALESGDETLARNRIWCWLLMTFFRYPQGILILFLVGTIAPGLIARDIRSKAFLLYFSRPIGKADYLLGKFFIPATFVMLVTTLPAMALYLFAILMSPDLSVFWSTWDVPLRILAGSFFLVVPTVSLALMFSALTQETRFASFGWFAFFTLGHGAWLAIVFSSAVRKGMNMPFDVTVMEAPEVKRWSLLSLYNNIGDAQSWVFGFSSWNDVMPSLIALAVISVASLMITYRQISSPLRV